MTAEPQQTITNARDYFPRGLYQPEGTFRFSMDALLLARFARSSKRRNGYDLGAGCGVIGLAMLLESDSLTMTGIELQIPLFEAATQNAEHLGLTDRYTCINADLATIKDAGCAPESADFVVANPPYRRSNQGRLSDTKERACALFETEGALQSFISAAAFLVKNKGLFYCIFPSERLDELMATCAQHKLTPKRLKCIHSKAEQNSTLVLLEARKNGNCGLTVEPPLVLYSGEGKNTALTDEALAFCPYLQCNARGR